MPIVMLTAEQTSWHRLGLHDTIEVAGKASLRILARYVLVLEPQRRQVLELLAHHRHQLWHRDREGPRRTRRCAARQLQRIPRERLPTSFSMSIDL